ncbi:MAG: nuclear transport factor 2 family protein [Mycolicibacterium hassiacum]|jgi:hypothetical protein|uniref:nuclear transport factor 2 family protein n=1 Tax=Mycolicibacterium hassiacum TaxID=46351 RepID=UPI0023F89616|nr:nuclear transport factor 2 family protein [Mycolicibacterium hassiacum]MBX5487489.1 nuclear transport factor 2 family protein [Mycolicibacterium hassiacum]
MDDSELRLRVAIGDLLASYQFFADTGRLDELVGLFTPDAEFRTNTEHLVGRESIREFFARTGAAFAAVKLLPGRHHLASVKVTPDGETRARTYACFQFIGVGGLDHWGTYRDTVVHTPDGWRFAARKATVEGHVPDSPVVRLLGLD